MRIFLSVLALSAMLRAAEHASTEFHLVVRLPYDQAFPLFGALAEQKWDPDWHPQFVYPQPPEDREGAVFTVSHGPHSSVWMLTRFDKEAGAVEYAHVQDGVVFTRIKIRLAKGGQQTRVAVLYERTAIGPKGGAQVRKLAAIDASAEPEWQAALDKFAASK